MFCRNARIIGFAAALITAALPAAAAVPSFTVQDIGVGVAVDVNARGTVIGQDSFSPGHPWVLDGKNKTYLPLPAGVTTATANRINDQGVIVGEIKEAYSDAGRPLVWWPTVGGYELEQLPLPEGATAGIAVDVNNKEVVLLSYGTPGRLVTGYAYMTNKPYLYSRAAGLTDLSTLYVLPPYPEPVDLTDGGRILLKSGEILEPSLTVTPTPPFPPKVDGGYSWTFFRASRINESGAFIGVATLSSSMDYAHVVKYVPESGWKVLGGLHVYVSANGIDAAGNVLAFANYVCPTNFGLVYAAPGENTYCLDDLILGGGWSFLGFTAKGALASGLPDGATGPGLMVALGYSVAAGTARLALITPAGDLPLPPEEPPAQDTEAPNATIRQPADGSTVTGKVAVEATFTDNVGLAYASLTFHPASGSDLICEQAPTSPAPTLTLRCEWDTSRVADKATSATITAEGRDALGNSVTTSVTVNVTYSSKKGGGKPRK